MIVAHNASFLPAQDILGTPRFGTVLELRIDPVKENLVNPDRILVRRDGVIVISQPQDYQLLFFTSSGTRVGSFGRRGTGPGEFPSRSFVMSGWVGDTLWIAQRLPHRITFITPQLRLSRDFVVPPFVNQRADTVSYPDLSLPEVAALLPSNRIIARGEQQAGDLVRDGKAPLLGEYFVRADAKGVIDRLIAHFPLDGSNYSVRYGADSRLAASGPLPFASKGVESFSSDGARLVAARVRTTGSGTQLVSLTAVDSSGKLQWRRDHALPAVPIPQPLRDSAYRAFFESREKNGQADAIRASVRNIPAFYPPLERMLVGNDYSIWLGLRRTSSGHMPWLILDSSGNVIGHLVMPPSETLRVGTLERIWTTRRDSTDLEAVLRYWLQRER